MAGFSDFEEAGVANERLGGTAFTVPGTHYFALSTTTPTDAGGNFTEPGVGSYARVAATNNSTTWPAASGGVKANGIQITFPTATAAWGTVTHFGIYDASSGGNLLYLGALTSSLVVNNGDTPRFPIGDLTITFD